MHEVSSAHCGYRQELKNMRTTPSQPWDDAATLLGITWRVIRAKSYTVPMNKNVMWPAKQCCLAGQSAVGPLQCSADQM